MKEVKAPFLFDGEHGIALHALQGNRAPSHGEGKVSWLFLSCSRNLGYILELRHGWPFKTRVFSATSGLMFTDEGQLGILPEPWSAIGTPLEVMWETQGSFPVATGILGFLSIFKGSQASSPFEALNSACLLRYQRDVEPPVEMSQTTRAFSGSPQEIQTYLPLVR